MMKILHRPITLFTFSCIVSIGTLLLYNIPFFSYVADNTNESIGGQIFLLASLAVVMLAVNFMMACLVMFLMRMVGRVLLAVLSVINATAVYFMMTYSVIIDATTIENVEEGEKNIDMLINAYDNTIHYTDFLLDSLINTLRSMDDWKSAMIFISDHGESLGENKIFMHGLPMKLAPKVQYEIPFLVWTSKDFRDYKSDNELPAVLEQHYIFHSVLNLLSIQSPAYNKDYDIFKR